MYVSVQWSMYVCIVLLYVRVQTNYQGLTHLHIYKESVCIYMDVEGEERKPVTTATTTNIYIYF